MSQTNFPFFPVVLGVFRPSTARPIRASGKGDDGSDPPFLTAGAVSRWGRCTTGCQARCHTPYGVAPVVRIPAGRLTGPLAGRTVFVWKREALSPLPFAVAAAFTPGPNNSMLAASGTKNGVRRTVPHILGVCGGVPMLVLAVGLRLGVLFERYPELHTVLKLVGAACLLVLAWRIATAGRRAADIGPGRLLTFLEAALFQLVNPKGWVFAVTAVATYTSVGEPAAAELTIVLAVCLPVSIGSTITWTVFGAGRNRFLHESPTRLRTFNFGMALLLVLSIGVVLT